ncbi:MULTISPECIES: glycosyl hydrolase 108 family protein [unclassified Arcicella]|uniref:glycosyl hydrolase 108 family protein n=1 Tax=unclassified Arcicella TaxID=2644986 RepID=UPI00285C9043|nr:MULTISPECIES: glycosyl hydrolase 108 family protein [unclassified Arcicella]MDR6564956.1 lysozyme family protein [Arcicella sp. BE51]MDR6814746.1 lysozyme family protein [Arcicella sp. BE140]MDR6826192.1 lysozyme family protein [Arcicella sp. BE139]
MKKFIILLLIIFRFTTCFSADFVRFFNNTISVEGKTFVSLKFDRGNETLYGITIGTYKRFCDLPKVPIVCDKNADKVVNYKDLALMKLGETKPIYKKYYWDITLADQIENQAVAEFISDFFVNSGGSPNNIKKIQGLVGVAQDGIIGKGTIRAINKQNPKILFDKIYLFRLDFYHRICLRDKTQYMFLKGWTNRIVKLKKIYQNGKFI